MEADLPKNLFIRRLASMHRVMLLGGMAVIAHGRSRHTKDFDIWLDPAGSVSEWTQNLTRVLEEFPASYVWSLAEKRRLELGEIAADVEDFGVIRVGGLELPVDVFRKPNELETTDFDPVWSRATVREDGVALPQELDLYVTKMNTGREHDGDDAGFLIGLVKKRFAGRLPICDMTEAKDLLDRFLDPEVLGFAQTNPNADVRQYVVSLLREFEAEGDPFSRDILAAWKEPA